MAKYLDKTPDEWEDLIEQWHNDNSLTMSLPEFLELDETEYMRLVHGIDDANLTPEEIIEEAGRRTRQAVVGLTLQEYFNQEYTNER